MRLGTCLVQLQCVSCVTAFAACVAPNKYCVLFLISLQLLCMGMDEARALVHALWNSSVSRVSILCSMFQWLDGIAQRRRAYANNAMVLYEIKLFCC